MKKARTKSGNSVPDRAGMGELPTRCWTLVANRTVARAFESVDGKGFRPVMGLTHPEGKLKEIELTADRPGRVTSSAASGRRHALSAGLSAHEQSAQEFAKRIALILRKARTEHALTELVLVAEPKFLGVLRAHLPKAVLGLITHEFAKEYPLMSDADLCRVLEKGMARVLSPSGRSDQARTQALSSVPLQIAFHGMSHSDAVEGRIREKVRALEKHYPRLTSVRVVAGRSSNRHRKGNQYEVTVELALPGGEIAAAAERAAHEDVFIALRNAFRASTRQLDDYVSSHFRDPKRHAVKRDRLTLRGSESEREAAV
jgi:protein required for attachment to host cells/ribosome-associated translation inhibitor RaiA